MNEAVKILVKEIEEHRIKLTELEEQRKKLDTELPLIKANLDALTRSLSIIQKEPIEPVVLEIKEPTSSDSDKRVGMREGSLTAIGYSVMKEVGSTLPIDDLFQRVKLIRPEVEKNSFTSGIYHLSRKKKIFRVRNGKVSLLE